MAGVEDASTIDLVAESPEGVATLFMVETRPWGNDLIQAQQLAAKVNTYYSYVAGGQLASEFPHLADRDVEIRLECPYPPTLEVQEVLSDAAAGLAPHGITLSVSVNPELRFGGAAP